MTDRLQWWEDIPLGLALVAQSYVVGLWYYASISGAARWVDLAVAIGAGLALDLIVVTTVMGRRQGRSSKWSWATSLGAFLCSSLIALDRYGWTPRSGLHVAFPLVVFLYSQHLATPRRYTPAVASQETPGATIAPNVPQTSIVSPAALSALPVVSIGVIDQAPPSAPLPTNGAHRYHCPHCGEAVATKQAVGAAVKNGYCLQCKASRKVA